MNHNVSEVSLDEIEPLSWLLLNDAIESNGAFRFPVLCTRSHDGVDARVLVLREADRATRTLEFHTDRRSPKLKQIESCANAGWVFYDPEHKLQLRIHSTGQVVTDQAIIESRWQSLNEHTQRAYAQELDPGLEVEALMGAAPCSDVLDSQIGRDNFSVVQCKVDEIRWLKLSRSGHQCAVARFTDSRWSSSWVMP